MKRILQISFLLGLSSAIFSQDGTSWQVSQAPNTADADQEAILKGITTIKVESQSGDTMTVYGDNAFPLMASEGWYSSITPVGAGGRFGKGRMIGFANRDVLFPASDQKVPPGPTDLDQFLLNMFTWLSGGKTPKNVALLDGRRVMMNFLKENGINTTDIPSYDKLKTFPNLSSFDFILTITEIPQDAVPVLQKYLDNGGGVAIAHTTWWISNRDVLYGTFANFGDNYPANQLSKNFGFVWRNVPGEPYGKPNLPDNGYNMSKSFLAPSTMRSQWAQIKAEMANPSDPLLNVVNTFVLGGRTVPRNQLVKSTALYNDVLRTVRQDQPVPTEARPVTSMSDKFKLKLFDALTSSVLRPEDVTAHPTANNFPGMNVSIPTNSPTKFTRTLSLNKTKEAWISTGTYALPGKTFQVKVQGLAPELTSSLILQVGIHRDDLSSKDSLSRPPLIIRKAGFFNGSVVYNSPYGGPVYVMSSNPSLTGPNPLTFTFDGVIAAPYFKLGETSLKEWKTSRLNPAPWAELVTEKVILSVLSADIRTLDDPVPILKQWDRSLDGMQDLLGNPFDRPYPERFAYNIQPSIGYLHSGYPCVGRFIHSKISVNLTELKTDESWGLWHEMGHNHQDKMWTFEGTGEVTNNVLGYYVYNVIVGLKPQEIPEMDYRPEKYQARIRKYLELNLDFKHWQDQPWLALVTYIQLQQVVGWEPFKKTFRAYNTLSEDQKPKDTQAKIDLWIIFMSQNSEKNLFDFYKSWGFPISASVNDKLAQYPASNISMLDLLK